MNPKTIPMKQPETPPTKPTAPKQPETPPTPDKVLLSRDVNGIKRTLRDLEAATKHFNNAVAELQAKDLLPLGLTDEIVTAMCFNDGSPIIAALKASADNTPAKTRFERRVKDQCAADEEADVKNIIARLGVAMDKWRLKDGLTLRDDERAIYLKAANNKVTFIPDEVINYFSEYAESQEAKEYVMEAHRIFAALVAFDRQTRILGANRVRGIGDAAAGAIPEIISIYDGKITLDLAAVACLDFKCAMVRENAMHFDNNYKIIPPER